MSLAAESRPRGIARIASCLVALSLAGAAVAAPADANHRFERIGFSIGDVAALVPVPNEMRAIIVTKGGEIWRVAGDRHVQEQMGSVPNVNAACGGGVLGAAWDTFENEALFVSYIGTGGASGKRFIVARFDIDGAKVKTPFNLLAYDLPATATCTNVGGGITVANDGRVIVGMGDFGNGPGAGQPSVITGKIHRLNQNPPGGAAPDNPNGASPIYALGVRNPVAMANDPASGKIWFVDKGPDLNDELNWINAPSLNFGWPRTTGPFETLGFRDPAHTFTTSINPVGLAVVSPQNFYAWAGDVVIASANGLLRHVEPLNLDATPPSARATTAFTPGTGDPASFATATTLPDGAIYVATPNGELYRFRNHAGAIQEPADRQSIVPTLVRRLSGGALEILTETESGATRLGFYPGDLASLYSHYDPASPLLPASTCIDTTGGAQGCISFASSPGSAWATATLSPAQVAAMPGMAYFYLSAIGDRAESFVGSSSNDQYVPGGDQSFGCPCPLGTTVGPDLDQCGPQFTVAQGVVGFNGAGAPIVEGPFNIPQQYECMVVMLDISAEWCPPCRAMAAEAESLYQEFKDRGFMMIHAINERDPRGSGPCDLACATRWAEDFGLTFPVLADGTSQGWDNYNMIDAWPQSLLISRDGVVVERFHGGFPRDVLAAAIEAEVSR